MSEQSITERAYTTPAALQRRYDNVARQMGLAATSTNELQTWQQALRARLRDLMGYDTLERAPLDPRITEEVACDGYRRQRVEIQVEPGVIMPLYVLIPDGDGPFPAVMAAHGHGSGGKRAVAGVRDLEWMDGAITEFNYDYGIQLARAGCIACCPDARGFGERLEAWMDGNERYSSCAGLNLMAIPLGRTVAGMWAWDLHRLIDYIETRADCRPGGVGCVGLSGGGLQTLYATALDTRIRCAAISGYFYGVKEALLDLHNCWCNYIPHLYEIADMGDLGALIAPRPLLIETGDQDSLNGASGLANVTSQVEITRRAYHLCDADDAITHAIFPGGHKWFGAGIDWVARWMNA